MLLCLLAMMVASAGAHAGELTDLSGRFAGYKLYAPERHRAGAAPLIVVLHGCDQDADQMARATRWSRLAEARGLFVLYPNQPRSRNPLGCWNWFLPANQQAGSGEPAEIMAAIDEVVAREPIDQSRVYVAGLSAGGAMATILMSCYPNRFAAGAIHSGIAYGLATGVTSALALMQQGPASFTRASTAACNPAAFHGGVLVVQGLADKTVAPANADRVFADFFGGHAVLTQIGPTAASDHSRAYRQVEAWVGGRLVGREILVEGMDHCWSGGDAALPYNDPKGPDATALEWAFFTPFAAREQVARLP